MKTIATLSASTPFYDLATWCIDHQVSPQTAELALRRAIMAEALAMAKGNKTQAARLCRMHRNSFAKVPTRKAK